MASPTYRLTRLAQLDLGRLYSFLAEHDIEVAQKALGLLKASFERLVQSPWAGPRLQGDVRVLTVRFGRGAYQITYKPVVNAIVILRLKHSREL